MVALFSWLIAILITFPILAYIIAYLLAKRIIGKKEKAVLFSIDISAFLLLCCIHITSYVVIGKSLLGELLLVSFIIFLLLGVLDNRLGRFSFKKVLKRGWRVNGIIYLMCYLVLFNYGLIMRVI